MEGQGCDVTGTIMLGGVDRSGHVHPPTGEKCKIAFVKPQVRERYACPRNAREAQGGGHVHPVHPPMSTPRGAR
jgi:hypothetical protein